MSPGQYINAATTKLFNAAGDLAGMVILRQISTARLDRAIKLVEDALAQLKEARKGKS